MRPEGPDWAAMLRRAVRLGIRPSDFWSLSLREWLWLCREDPPAGGLSAASLKALRAQIENFDKEGQADD